MKFTSARRLLLVLATLFALAITGVALAGAKHAATTPFSCGILDNAGNVVTTVNAIDIGDPPYWLNFASGGVVSTTLTITLRQAGGTGPLELQKWVFHPGDTGIHVPFGIPKWANNATSGEWRFRAANTLGNAVTCKFTVVQT